jgi:hypothetical protein
MRLRVVNCATRGISMTSQNEYRLYARECARWAAQTKNQKDREAFLDMAKAWTHIALVQRDVVRQSAFDKYEAMSSPR